MANLRRYNISEGVSLSKPVNLQDITVHPSTVQQIISYNSDLGFNGLGTVIVDPVTASIDPNIKPENIVKGVSILGVEGVSAGDAKLTNIYAFKRAGDQLITELVSDADRAQQLELYTNGNLYNTYDLIYDGLQGMSTNYGTFYYQVFLAPTINLLDLEDGSYQLKARLIGTLNPTDFTEEISYACYTVNTTIDDKTHNKRGNIYKQNTDSLYTDNFVVGTPALNLSYELTNPEWETYNGWLPEFVDDDGFYSLKDRERLGMNYIAVAKVILSCDSEQTLKVRYRVDRSETYDHDPGAWIWANKYVGFGFGALDIDPGFPRTEDWGVDPHFQENRDSYVFTTVNAIEIPASPDWLGYETMFPSLGNDEPFFYRTEYEVDYGTISAGEHFFYIVNYKNQSWGTNADYLFDFKFQVQQSYSDNGYKLPDNISVKVDGVETSNYSYDSTTGEFSINLTGTTEVSFNSVAK